MNLIALPAGSIVKYGTTTAALPTILQNGIAEQTVRAGLSGGGGGDGSGGVFVGELIAYFSACASFCEATRTLHDAHQDVMRKFVHALQTTHGVRPDLAELDAIAAQAALPVVLEITLGETCALAADSQFAELPETSWETWRSGALQRAGGIPPQWITAMYFPRLLEYRDTGDARSRRMLEQTTDSALMVGGLMQVWHKDQPADLLAAFKKQYGRCDFSQKSRFDAAALERFFKLNALLDPATRLLNQMTIWQDIDALARKQGIALG